MIKNKTPILFADYLAELEKLVTQMEQGGLSLEESLKAFERGVKLTNLCQKTLRNAEQKVQVLLKKNGTQTLDDFSDD